MYVLSVRDSWNRAISVKYAGSLTTHSYTPTMCQSNPATTANNNKTGKWPASPWNLHWMYMVNNARRTYKQGAGDGGGYM